MNVKYILCHSLILFFFFFFRGSNQKINNTEKYFDQTWGQYANAVAKQATMIERQIEEDNRQVSHYLALENKRLARLQRERQDYLNSTVYCSAPTADFYQQFNTTSR